MDSIRQEEVPLPSSLREEYVQASIRQEDIPLPPNLQEDRQEVVPLEFPHQRPVGVRGDNFQPRFSQPKVDEENDLHQAGGETVCVAQPIDHPQVQVLEGSVVDEGSSIEPPHVLHEAGDAPDGSRGDLTKELGEDEDLLQDDLITECEEKAEVHRSDRVQAGFKDIPEDEKEENMKEMENTVSSIISKESAFQPVSLPKQSSVFTSGSLSVEVVEYVWESFIFHFSKLTIS